MPSLFDLTGKVAIVTGSSRGIGRAIAERLAEHGARVVISSRKLAPCQEVADAIDQRHGAGRATACAANISSKEALQALGQNPETLERATRTSPLRRIGEPDEIAGAAVFLAAKASSFTTGHTIMCDGGVLV